MGFSACHPAVSFLYFACVIAAALALRHPVYLAVAFIGSFAYAVKLRRARGAALGLILLPCAAAFALWYASIHHFGVTVLRQNFVDNNITLEALVSGAALGLSVSAALMWLACVHEVFTADKVVYLFGRVLKTNPPKSSRTPRFSRRSVKTPAFPPTSCAGGWI